MPKPEHGYKKPLTKKGKLSERGKAKLKDQITRAERLMRTNKEYSENWFTAKRVRDRARKLLGTKTPAGKPKKSSLSEGARGVVELAKRAAKAPGKFKKGLEKAKEASESGGTPSRSARKKAISPEAYDKYIKTKKRD